MASNEKSWHVCDDCLDPIARDLRPIYSAWIRAFYGNVPENESPDDVRSREILEVLEKHQFERGVEWLKVHIGIEYGRELQQVAHHLVDSLKSLRDQALRQFGATSGQADKNPIFFAISHELLNLPSMSGVGPITNLALLEAEIGGDTYFVRYASLHSDLIDLINKLASASEAIRQKLSKAASESAGRSTEYDRWRTRALATELGVTDQTIRNWIDSEILIGSRDGHGFVRVTPESVERQRRARARKENSE